MTQAFLRYEEYIHGKRNVAAPPEPLKAGTTQWNFKYLRNVMPDVR